MTFLSDVFDPDLFSQMVEEGYVRVQRHPTGPLLIANYSEKTQFDRKWNDVTRNCRGLIFNSDTTEVLARPFRKFHNYGEAEAAHLELHDIVEVTDKQDGSLGILYPSPDGGYAIATRGSFTSDQAIHGTEIWRKKYADNVIVDPNFTYLFEIIYPQNRIVLDYGDLDDLVMIGAVNIATGRSLPVAAKFTNWPGPEAEMFVYTSLADALAAEPRPNAEGYVVHFLESDERLKIKQADYVALHRIVTGLSARTVWQHIVDGKDLKELIEPLPDEFHDWVRKVEQRLAFQVDVQRGELLREFTQLTNELPSSFTRRDFAMKAVQSPNKWAMFLLLDERPDAVHAELWKRAKPEPETPAGKVFSEETA